MTDTAASFGNSTVDPAATAIATARPNARPLPGCSACAGSSITCFAAIRSIAGIIVLLISQFA